MGVELVGGGFVVIILCALLLRRRIKIKVTKKGASLQIDAPL